METAACLESTWRWLLLTKRCYEKSVCQCKGSIDKMSTLVAELHMVVYRK